MTPNPRINARSPTVTRQRTREHQRPRGQGKHAGPSVTATTHALRSGPAQTQLALLREEVIPSQLIRTTQAKRCRQPPCTPSSMKTAGTQDARRRTNRARHSRRHAEEASAATSSPGSSRVQRSVVAKRDLRPGHGSRADGSARLPVLEREIDLRAHAARTGRVPPGPYRALSSPRYLVAAKRSTTSVGGCKRKGPSNSPGQAPGPPTSCPTRDASQNKRWHASLVDRKTTASPQTTRSMTIATSPSDPNRQHTRIATRLLRRQARDCVAASGSDLPRASSGRRVI